LIEGAPTSAVIGPAGDATLRVTCGSPVSPAGPKVESASLCLICCEENDSGPGRRGRLCHLNLPQKMRGHVPVLPLVCNHRHRLLGIAFHHANGCWAPLGLTRPPLTLGKAKHLPVRPPLLHET